MLSDSLLFVRAIRLRNRSIFLHPYHHNLQIACVGGHPC